MAIKFILRLSYQCQTKASYDNKPGIPKRDMVVLNDVNKRPLRYEGTMHFLQVGRNYKSGRGNFHLVL